MKKIKKNIIFLCVITLVFVLAGCSKDSGKSKTTVSTTENVTTTEIVTTTEATTEPTTEATTEFIIEEYNIGEQYDANIETDGITTEVPLATGPSSVANVVPVENPDPNVDVDLTVYTISDMVIVINDMLMNPNAYLGKTIKLSGPYHPLINEDTGEYYHYIKIEDETACCESGVEFIWDEDSHTYPDEYPKEHEMIEIVGVYSVYEEEGYTYYYLDVDGYTVVY